MNNETEKTTSITEEREEAGISGHSRESNQKEKKARDSEAIPFAALLPRFFVRQRHVAWVLLLATLAWGVAGYFGMPQRKDPETPIHIAAAITSWPGASAEQIEQLVTRRIEARVSENAWVERVESISRTHFSVVFVHLDKRLSDTSKAFDDIAFKLESLKLPEGAGPVDFIKDFGDTAALMLTVASPRVDATEIKLRARLLEEEIRKIRNEEEGKMPSRRLSAVLCFPQPVSQNLLERPLELFAGFLREKGAGERVRTFEMAGMVGADFSTTLEEAEVFKLTREFLEESMHWPGLSLEAWEPFLVSDLSDCQTGLNRVAGPKYSIRQLDEMSELIEKTIKTLPQVSKITRVGKLQEAIYLLYTQERLAAHGIKPADLPRLLEARNRLQPGGMLSASGRHVMIEGSGAFKNEDDLGRVILAMTGAGSPLYLRDVFDRFRGYEDPPRYLNRFARMDHTGRWQSLPAITLAVQMRPGEKIGAFGSSIDGELAALRQRLPPDLILERTSDQPAQVRENVSLFLKSLLEAIVLVVLVSWIGFWDWRTALLMAVSIPVTLAMTFGLMLFLGIDLQQVSIASLIIALGLLVDVPVVAGDSIKRLLGSGVPPDRAAWLGPSRLNTALFFATLTNVVAYLPFLLLSGNVGRFLYSLPIVITCSLISANLVSLTFVPLISYYLLRPAPEPGIEELRRSGFYAAYGRLMGLVIRRRWLVLTCAALLLFPGVWAFRQLKQQFFPKDLSYLSYVDVWLPDDAPLSATSATARRAEAVIAEVAAAWGKKQSGGTGESRPILSHMTTFVGGGGPRFWFSVEPELRQLNYAQILLQVHDKHDTQPLVPRLQEALSAKIPGARFDVRQLETGEPVGIPVSVRLSGQDLEVLRSLAGRLKQVFRQCPFGIRIRDDWGTPNLTLTLKTRDDQVNLSGLTHLDVTAAAATAISGFPVTRLRERDREIPVLARLSIEERSRLSDLENLYVFSLNSLQRVPLGQVADLEYSLKPEKIRRRNQFRTITVSCFPAEGFLPSQVVGWLEPHLASFAAGLPVGYRLEIGGEKEKQVKGFRELALVLLVSVGLIYLALVFQFSHAFKPLIVFGAIPFGMMGAILVLFQMGSPFGFMAFLGVASLVGVIVSHIIVLFDFIEEAREHGRSLEEALLDAGIMRLRPVLITVAATLIALLPLATHGGPLWEPLCYAQIGGLAVATLVTLVLVPLLYAVFVLDLRIVHWDAPKDG